MKLIVFTTVACLIILLYACQNEKEIEQQRYYINGKGLFEQHCQNCHGAGGEGLGELYPPLTDTIFLRKNKRQLACIIKNGSEGVLTIHGKQYEGKMPAEADLSDIEVAEIISYVTNSFGNNQGSYNTADAAKHLAGCK